MLFISNPDTARSILSTLIGGIISLTVFSFSMVMVLLSQASSNFSPRLLPGLISDTRNQITLGIFLGTIIFNMIVLITILPGERTYTTSGFSVLIGIILGILCLAMFVYFIHFMSTEIQISNILNRIFEESKERLKGQIALQADKQVVEEEEDQDWHYHQTQKAGYYQGINKKGILKKIEEEEINLKIIPHKGMYTLPHTEVFGTSKKIDDSVQSEIRSYLIFENNHEATDNYVLGMRQISEVAVKAMSPGINDPGTAVISIDFLTELLALRMKLSDIEEYRSSNGKYFIRVETISFASLLYELMASFRQYSKHDPIVMEKLARMLLYLQKQAKYSNKYVKVIHSAFDQIKMDVESHISNNIDREHLMKLIDLRGDAPEA